MTRRGHRRFSIKLIGGGIAVLVILAVGGAILLDKALDPFRTIEKLKPTDYFENANSLRGNTYQVNGTIAGSLGWKQNQGRLFALRINSDGKEWPVPLWVPSSFQELNLQKGQHYRAKVRVHDSGVLCVEEMSKS